MARLMLSIGDVQVSVQPIPGSINERMMDWCKSVGIPATQIADHPLLAGDHEVTFYEIGYGSGGDHFISGLMGENAALQLVAAWLMVDEGPTEHDAAVEALREAFGDSADIEWLLP